MKKFCEGCFSCIKPCGREEKEWKPKNEESMTVVEAIKSGKPHRRKNDNFVYFVPMVGGIGYSQADILADDWEIVDKPKVHKVAKNVINLESKKIQAANRKRKAKKNDKV